MSYHIGNFIPLISYFVNYSLTKKPYYKKYVIVLFFVTIDVNKHSFWILGWRHGRKEYVPFLEIMSAFLVSKFCLASPFLLITKFIVSKKKILQIDLPNAQGYSCQKLFIQCLLFSTYYL